MAMSTLHTLANYVRPPPSCVHKRPLISIHQFVGTHKEDLVHCTLPPPPSSARLTRPC
ncbi:hypothetical protein CALCODRAFT_496224 [Calocera cornea HHB12733]|uniref:Uncharacterized protein n=1 Tax=Calocera cornea HHB12733 TaxID=1353952 RepID=A0A165FZU9_9BASI|nr:hypothetical protein CALCODRAFT_496224 [Calocera cornea HHB12733]